MVAAYSAGETALVLVSAGPSSSARPLGSTKSTTLVPNNRWGCGAVIQSAGAPSEKRPCGSVQVTRSLAAGLATGVAVWSGLVAAAAVAWAVPAALLGATNVG